MVREYLVMD